VRRGARDASCSVKQKTGVTVSSEIHLAHPVGGDAYLLPGALPRQRARLAQRRRIAAARLRVRAVGGDRVAASLRCTELTGSRFGLTPLFVPFLLRNG
jgi:hypothetical protein